VRLTLKGSAATRNCTNNIELQQRLEDINNTPSGTRMEGAECLIYGIYDLTTRLGRF